MKMKLGDFLSKNLIAVLGMLATLATGYFAGMTRAAEIERDVNDLKETEKSARPFRTCLVMTIYQMRLDSKATPPCELKVPE